MHPQMIKKRIFYEKNAPQAIFYEIKCAAGKTYETKCAAGRIFLTMSSWVLCPVNAVRKLFATNLSSESSSFNSWINYQFMNKSIHKWSAYSKFIFPTAMHSLSGHWWCVFKVQFVKNWFSVGIPWTRRWEFTDDPCGTLPFQVTIYKKTA